MTMHLFPICQERFVVPRGYGINIPKFSDDCLKLLRHVISIMEKFESTLGPVPDEGKKHVYYHFYDSVQFLFMAKADILGRRSFE